jgi:hypothetical protein
MKKVLFLFAIGLFTWSSAVFAQVRPIEKPEPATTRKAPAPASFVAKYEGGMIGFNSKEQGTLKFDDINERLVFSGKDGKEDFSLAYSAILLVSPNERKVQSGTGRAIGAVPIIGAGLGGSLLKKKKNYLIIQYRDTEVDVQGTANFLIDTGELLDSVVQTIGEKAELKQRGDAYYRPRKASDGND